jgi:aryl-alcohol dehydrogenase-like predicted oxidoreductase
MDAPEMLALCERQNLASVNRSPLARGALTGKYSKNVVFAESTVKQVEENAGALPSGLFTSEQMS